MISRLLHGALALSLGSAPASDAQPPPSTEPGSTPDGDAPAASAPTDPDDATPSDGSAPPADDAATPPPADAAPAADDSTPSSDDAPAPDDAAPPTSDEPTDDGATPSDEPTTEPEPPAPVPATVQTPPPEPVKFGPAPSGRNRDIVNKALLGGGIASLTLGLGLIGPAAWAWREHAEARRALDDLESGSARNDAEDRRDQMRTIGVITSAAAGVYTTTGIVLLLLNTRDRRNARRTTVAPTVGSMSGVVVRGRF